VLTVPRTMHILLVEDDSDDYLITCDVLSDMPATEVSVTRACNYQEAIAALQHSHYDIALIDYQLGTETGLDVVRDAVNAGVDTPLILCTGHGDETLAVKALQAGARDYLVKSKITTECLERAFTHAIDKQILERQLAEQQAELEHANQQLARKNADIRSFHHTVSHELKNPLTAAMEFASILEDGLAGALNPEQLEYVGIIHGACTQMNRMIDDLLDAGRIENGKLALAPMPTDLGNALPPMVQAMAPLAEEAGIHLSLNVATDIPLLPLDTSRIRQVVTNLVANGIKFTHAGGRIDVTADMADAPGGMVRIAVADTGAGIPAEQLDMIFERFYQSDDDRDQGKGGLGLGLAICKGIIDLHHGRVEVQSTPGEGSRFSCLLPISGAESPGP